MLHYSIIFICVLCSVLMVVFAYYAKAICTSLGLIDIPTARKIHSTFGCAVSGMALVPAGATGAVNAVDGLGYQALVILR